jgi:hypothetical protein
VVTFLIYYFGSKKIMGPIGFNELIILVVLAILILFFGLRFIYKYGQQKGRIKEMERQLDPKSKV